MLLRRRVRLLDQGIKRSFRCVIQEYDENGNRLSGLDESEIQKLEDAGLDVLVIRLVPPNLRLP